eukprot:252464-Pleurochrysis_carterae.AAC.2
MLSSSMPPGAQEGMVHARVGRKRNSRKAACLIDFPAKKSCRLPSSAAISFFLLRPACETHASLCLLKPHRTCGRRIVRR